MIWIILLLIIIFAYCDLALLKKQNAILFTQVSRLPKWVWPTYGVLLPLLYWSTRNGEDIFAILFLFAFPVYLIKRNQFLSRLHREALENADGALSDLNLASDAFGIMLHWFLWIVGAVAAIKIMREAWDYQASELGEMVALAALSLIVMFLLIVRGVRQYANLSLKDVLGLRSHDHPWIKLFFLPALLGAGFAYVGTKLILGRVTQPDTPLNQAIDQANSAEAILFFVGIAVLVAPLFEELIFRGYFFYIIEKFKGKIFAIFFVALSFGILHVDQYWGDWLAIGIVMALGFTLTSFRAWTGSSIPGIVMHYVYNAGMTILPIVMLVMANPSYFEYQSQYERLTWERKQELLLQNIRENPGYVEAYNDLAWLYAQEGRNLDEALRLIERALTLDPQRSAFLDTKAEVLFRLGRIEEAIKVEEILKEKDPANENVIRQLERFKKALPETGNEPNGTNTNALSNVSLRAERSGAKQSL